MIFLTVGTQLPFDRLIEAVDRLAPLIKRPIFAQVGERAEYIPKHFAFERQLDSSEFAKKAHGASLILSHAGIGSILTARKYQIPAVLFPRRASMGEHRNEHQLDTCSQMKHLQNVYVALEERELTNLLMSEATYSFEQTKGDRMGQDRLQSAIYSFIHDSPTR